MDIFDRPATQVADDRRSFAVAFVVAAIVHLLVLAYLELDLSDSSPVPVLTVKLDQQQLPMPEPEPEVSDIPELKVEPAPMAVSESAVSEQNAVEVEITELEITEFVLAELETADLESAEREILEQLAIELQALQQVRPVVETHSADGALLYNRAIQAVRSGTLPKQTSYRQFSVADLPIHASPEPDFLTPVSILPELEFHSTSRLRKIATALQRIFGCPQIQPESDRFARFKGAADTWVYSKCSPR